MRADCGHPELVETVPAEEIQLGDCLLEMDGDRLYPAPVISITTTRQQGIYAPLTDSGKVDEEEEDDGLMNILPAHGEQHRGLVLFGGGQPGPRREGASPCHPLQNWG